jgi:hypothetical protein
VAPRAGDSNAQIYQRIFGRVWARTLDPLISQRVSPILSQKGVDFWGEESVTVAVPREQPVLAPPGSCPAGDGAIAGLRW